MILLDGFLWLFYEFLRVIIWICFGLYFPFHYFKNKERLRFRGPGIVVTNHPNTLTDPLHLLIRMPRHAKLLANASLFKSKVGNFLLSHLYCIPIRRPGKDDTNKKVSNEDSFAKSSEHLRQDGILYVAPEGTSYIERRLRPLKTGTARIALSAEASADFGLELKIYPVGLTYERPTDCGFGLYLEAAEPIRVADFREAYETNPRDAAYALTAELERRMQTTLLHPDDEAQDQLLYRLEIIQKNDVPLHYAAHYDRSKLLLQRLQQLKATDEAAYHELATKTAQYRETLQQYELTDRGIRNEARSVFTPLTVLGWPVWLYGRLNNLIPFELPRWLERKLALDIGYRSTVKLLGGLLLFPLFYGLQFVAVRAILPTPYAWGYLLSLPLSGILAWAYARHVRPRWEGRRWRAFQRANPEVAEELERQRRALQAFLWRGKHLKIHPNGSRI